MDPLAAYGALVATLAILWQAYTWIRDRSTRVDVHLARAWTFPGSAKEVALVTAVNRSRHAVRVTGVGLEPQDGSDNMVVQLYDIPGATIPGTVAARDSGQTYWDLGELAARVDLSRPIVARIDLSTTEQFRSKPKSLRTK